MTGQSLDDKLATAARWIEEADGILIAAGAGMGVDSGLPDFRGQEGFWRVYPALKAAGINFQEIANPRAFRKQPELAWGFYGHRLDLYRNTQPHEGFQILRRWAASKPHGCRVFTSNVDGQFQRAGFPDADVYECHGSIHWLQCSPPCRARVIPADGLEVAVDVETGRWSGPLPTCTRCGALLRPAVLMFNDFVWESNIFERKGPPLKAWLSQVQKLVVIEMGAGLGIPTVRHFAEASAATGQLVRINLRDAEVEGANAVGIGLGALQALAALGRRSGR
jgi:NAD-dependent SIR2 family protein deacetylase